MLSAHPGIFRPEGRPAQPQPQSLPATGPEVPDGPGPRRAPPTIPTRQPPKLPHQGPHRPPPPSGLGGIRPVYRLYITCIHLVYHPGGGRGVWAVLGMPAAGPQGGRPRRRGNGETNCAPPGVGRPKARSTPCIPAVYHVYTGGTHRWGRVSGYNSWWGCPAGFWPSPTGKTVVAVHLAHALAIRGARTLLVDADPQAPATIALGFKPDPAFFKLAAGLTDPLDAVRESGRPNLWLVPADSQVPALPVLLNARHEPVDYPVPIFRKLAPHFAYIIRGHPTRPGWPSGADPLCRRRGGHRHLPRLPGPRRGGKGGRHPGLPPGPVGLGGPAPGHRPEHGGRAITRQAIGTLAGEYPGLLLHPPAGMPGPGPDRLRDGRLIQGCHRHSAFQGGVIPCIPTPKARRPGTSSTRPA